MHLKKSDLISFMEESCTPRSQWKIGTEHERFLFRKGKRLPYDGGIDTLLESFIPYGWEPLYEKDTLLALKRCGQTLTLEPGGQLELSGAPLETLHATAQELNAYEHELSELCLKQDISMVLLGFDPLSPLGDVPRIPKERYSIMRRWMASQGQHGLDMMHRTATVQVNLDFESERDMIEKTRIGMALQPVIVALFANSPFVESQPSSYVSFRHYCWQHTDPSRCGTLPFVFDENFGFERWVDYILDVPMLFIQRDNKYTDVTGQSFRDFMKGALAEHPGLYPTKQDWCDHMSVAFPEVRMRSYLEMRGADTGDRGMLLALPSLWTGLLYDASAQSQCLDMISAWSVDEIVHLHKEVCRQGFDTRLGKRTVRDIAQEIVTIAREGLRHRDQGEEHYLDPLDESLRTGHTSTQRLITAFQTSRTPFPVFFDHHLCSH